jgi:hypothetical protein
MTTETSAPATEGVGETNFATEGNTPIDSCPNPTCPTAPCEENV